LGLFLSTPCGVPICNFPLSIFLFPHSPGTLDLDVASPLSKAPPPLGHFYCFSPPVDRNSSPFFYHGVFRPPSPRLHPLLDDPVHLLVPLHSHEHPLLLVTKGYLGHPPLSGEISRPKPTTNGSHTIATYPHRGGAFTPAGLRPNHRSPVELDSPRTVRRVHSPTVFFYSFHLSFKTPPLRPLPPRCLPSNRLNFFPCLLLDIVRSIFPFFPSIFSILCPPPLSLLRVRRPPEYIRSRAWPLTPFGYTPLAGSGSRCKSLVLA